MRLNFFFISFSFLSEFYLFIFFLNKSGMKNVFLVLAREPLFFLCYLRYNTNLEKELMLPVFLNVSFLNFFTKNFDIITIFQFFSTDIFTSFSSSTMMVVCSAHFSTITSFSCCLGCPTLFFSFSLRKTLKLIYLFKSTH